jgi:hypothetical protein
MTLLGGSKSEGIGREPIFLFLNWFPRVTSGKWLYETERIWPRPEKKLRLIDGFDEGRDLFN